MGNNGGGDRAKLYRCEDPLNKSINGRCCDSRSDDGCAYCDQDGRSDGGRGRCTYPFVLLRYLDSQKAS